MRPALISRTKRRGTTALAPALRLFFVAASDMCHLYCDLTRTRLALDHDSAGKYRHDIGWDDRRWNGCASSSPSCGVARPKAADCLAAWRNVRRLVGFCALQTASRRT